MSVLTSVFKQSNLCCLQTHYVTMGFLSILDTMSVSGYLCWQKQISVNTVCTCGQLPMFNLWAGRYIPPTLLTQFHVAFFHRSFNSFEAGAPPINPSNTVQYIPFTIYTLTSHSLYIHELVIHSFGLLVGQKKTFNDITLCSGIL